MRYLPILTILTILTALSSSSTAIADSNPFERELQRRAVAAGVTAGEVIERCRSLEAGYVLDEEQLRRDVVTGLAYCLGFVTAISHTLKVMDSLQSLPSNVCVRADVSGYDVLTALRSFVQQYPGAASLSAVPVSLTAWAATFPCGHK